jgi:hypothetical protein
MQPAGDEPINHRVEVHDLGEAFPGRCAEVGDDLGSRMVTARLVRDLMRLVLLVERRYPPYGKWLGIASRRSSLAAVVEPALAAALAAGAWRQREEGLRQAYEMVAHACNELEIAEPVDPAVRPFHDRPFRVLGADRFADALRRAITDPEMSALPPWAGAADQFIDSTEVLTVAKRARAVVKSLHS